MGIRCEPFSQSIFNMSEHIKRFEMELLKGNITHDGSRIMRWQMGCVVLHRDNSENVKLVKKLGSDAKKIDGVIASIMAFGQCVNETKSAPPENFTFEVIGLD
jgi:phage terminase large subunit-like protein